jgi:hypothetical protein
MLIVSSTLPCQTESAVTSVALLARSTSWCQCTGYDLSQSPVPPFTQHACFKVHIFLAFKPHSCWMTVQWLPDVVLYP